MTSLDTGHTIPFALKIPYDLLSGKNKESIYYVDLTCPQFTDERKYF